MFLHSFTITPSHYNVILFLCIYLTVVQLSHFVSMCLYVFLYSTYSISLCLYLSQCLSIYCLIYLALFLFLFYSISLGRYLIPCLSNFSHLSGSVSRYVLPLFVFVFICLCFSVYSLIYLALFLFLF